MCGVIPSIPAVCAEGFFRMPASPSLPGALCDTVLLKMMQDHLLPSSETEFFDDIKDLILSNSIIIFKESKK